MYSTQARKRCRVGGVTSVARSEQMIIVQRYYPRMDSRLRVRWKPAFLGKYGSETLDPGPKPSLEKLDVSRILDTTTLDRQGVIGHRVSRKLDNSDWLFDSTTLDNANEAPENARIQLTQFRSFLLTDRSEDGLTRTKGLQLAFRTILFSAQIT